MEIYFYLIIGGILTGFINTLAGSGSAISLTVLDLIGLPLDIANATNRVAILCQNTISVTVFTKKKKLNIKKALPFALIAIPGGFCGAYFSIALSIENFRFVLGIIMTFILISLFIQPKKWLNTNSDDDEDKKLTIKDLFIFLLIGFYGGFIQVGIGILLLLGLVLNSGMSLIKANSIKVLFILCQAIPATLFFIYKGLIRWDIGLVLALGNMLGAWLGANEACKRGSKFIRYILIVIVAYAAIKYTFL